MLSDFQVEVALREVVGWVLLLGLSGMRGSSSSFFSSAFGSGPAFGFSGFSFWSL